jgi:ADP-ribosylglycohydrolase
MLGAITGDIIGSVYEHDPVKTTDFLMFGPRSAFTDDTVYSIAVAEALLGDGNFAASLRRYARKYPRRGYVGMFLQWAFSDELPDYGSWGNGSAMRVGAVAYLARDEAEVLDLAARQSAVTHSHADAITGAQATALAMWLGRQGAPKGEILRAMVDRFSYDLNPCVAEIRDGYSFDVSAKGTVPPAIVCALEADDYEGAVRNAVSLGGDADTLDCIASGIAETLYGLPLEFEFEARQLLDETNHGLPEEISPRATG